MMDDRLANYNEGWNAAMDAIARLMDARVADARTGETGIAGSIIFALTSADKSTAEIARSLKRQSRTPEPAA